VSLALSTLLGLIEANSGLRLNPGQAEDLRLALEKLAADQQTTPEDLVNAFENGQRRELLQWLQAKFTISETHFYRIAPQIEALKKTVLPELIATHRLQRRLRFWSAGCSSGEEAYTLLMLLEEIGDLEDWDLRVLGTDLNPDVLELARVGSYGHWSFRDTPFAAIERFFRVSGSKYQISQRIKNRADFEVLNLVAPQDQTDQMFDLIICRNVTIYFAPDMAQRVYQKLAAQLLPGAWLILGPSDPPMQPATSEQLGLELVMMPGVIFWKKPEQAHHQKPKPILNQNPKTPNLELWQDHLRDGYNSLMAKDYNKALEQLRRAVFLEPNQPIPQIGLAQALLGVHQQARALSALRQARSLLALEPNATFWGCTKSCQELIRLVEELLEQIELPKVNP
jgi:chemotaxis methyl-accepting protein methylase